MYDSNRTVPRHTYEVLLILPPDFEAPKSHRPYRFPHQGPAIVAAAIADDGFHCRAADLDVDIDTRPLVSNPALLDDRGRVGAYVSGASDEAYMALGNELIDRLDQAAVADSDAFALSIDRHTQIGISLLLGIELKRRFGLPIILGGANAHGAAEQAQQFGLRGIDVLTTAVTPLEIRAAFAVLREMKRGRWEVPVDPITHPLPTAPDEWPVADFSIYNLEQYRRDPFLASDGPHPPAYDRSIGRRLVLPYHFSWDCQYACTFCERGGTQTVKSVQRAVRDLATLAERYDCRDFMMFDAQINHFANDFAKQLIDARVNIQWTDSFRVAPRRPHEVLETMARSGCVGLTFGVESVSNRMLKRMVKGHNADQATAVVKDAHALEMFVRVNLLPCFPGETVEDHRTTVEWVREHAAYIDEVVPSSFYLASNSPVLQLTERYGITVRGGRDMAGDYKFRKNFGSLAYDEIDGYSWEEREAMLRPAEEDLRQAWAAGRPGMPSLLQPSQVFALRGIYGRKEDCYAAAARWWGMPRPQASASRGTNGTATVLQPPGPVSAQALSGVDRLVSRLQLSAALQAAPASQLALRLSDRDGAAVVLFLERAREGGRYYDQNPTLGMWYKRDADTAEDPKWLAPAIKVLTKWLLAPTFAGIAAELS
jgi:hypothetical protein